MTSGHHESLERDPVPHASARAFGWVMTAVFAIVAAWPLMDGGGVRLWAAAIAASFALAALVRPALLAPLNRAWMALGQVLHAVVSPLIMGLVYAVAVIPTGLYLKLARKDPLRLTYDPSAQSYWIARTPPGPPRGSFTPQY
ncbi:MAG: SxtJ family membrane protein [Rhodospirillaceae bacterium]|nr:SxtJ family membrane protein [Rhodospirillaceae bacterium]